MLRAMLAGMALMVLGAGAASAQITTYVAPPRPLAPTPAMVAVADSVRQDSVSHVAMTNMKAWVDSAAGVSVPPGVGADSATGRIDEAPVVTSFANGSVAPATASSLPAMAVVGVAALFAGAALLATRPRG